MDSMKKYFHKLRRFFRARRRTRKKAVWQNALIAIILAAVCIFALKGYAEENTFEAALDQYCEKNFFIDAEVAAVVTYEGKFSADERLNKNAVIRRYISEDEYYQAIIMAYKSNPLKWTTSGSAVSDNLQTIKFSPEMIKKTGKNTYDFSEAGIPGISLKELYGLYAEDSIYGAGEKITVSISDDRNRIDVWVDFLWTNYKPYQDFNVPLQHFYVDLETGECSRSFAEITVRESISDPETVTKTLWISDDVLIRAAEIMADAITSEQ